MENSFQTHNATWVFNQSPVIRIKSTIDRPWLVVETARGRISASSYGFNQAICLLPCRAVGQTSFPPDFFNRRAHVWCVCFDFSIPIWVWPKSDLDWLNRSLTCCRNCERPHTCIVLRIQLSQLLVDLLLLLKDGKNFTSYYCNDRLAQNFAVEYPHQMLQSLIIRIM